jgi:chemotaxis protein methyltransferase CheR
MLNRSEPAFPLDTWALSTSLPFMDIDDGPALAQAIVETIREPLLVLDKDLRVVAANRSFYLTFKVEQQNVQGRLVYALGDGEWNIPELRKLLEKILPKHTVMETYEVEQSFAGIGHRTMLLNARQVVNQRSAQKLILLAIDDVSERRAAERQAADLLKQKEILLEEMQHRVANSLQIIASILMLKARTVQSEETRSHLRDAHDRVMSVATVQQQLQASGHGEAIELGPYLSRLCDTLSASMIGDSRPITLKVEADAGSAVSGEAVSIGLMITELVINALKHAFPSGNGGEILVSYVVEGANWRLSVSDNGVGLQRDRDGHGRTGLGTSIVEALAHQLRASVEITSRQPGMIVSIAHAA